MGTIKKQQPKQARLDKSATSQQKQKSYSQRLERMEKKGLWNG